MTIRTWQQQQEHERQVRLDWMQAIIDSGMTQTEAADRLGVNRGALMRMFKDKGVTFPTVNNGMVPSRSKRAEIEARHKAKKKAKAEAAARAKAEREAKAKAATPKIKLSASPRAVSMYEARNGR